MCVTVRVKSGVDERECVLCKYSPDKLRQKKFKKSLQRAIKRARDAAAGLLELIRELTELTRADPNPGGLSWE